MELRAASIVDSQVNLGGRALLKPLKSCSRSKVNGAGIAAKRKWRTVAVLSTHATGQVRVDRP